MSYDGAGRVAGQPLWQPGVIPLRPLSLTDIFNGAVGYVRANPKPTLGLTTVVVLSTTVLGFLLGLATSSGDGNIRIAARLLIGGAATVLATTLLSGMLTVVVARSVLGSSISVEQAWHQVRGRLPALIGLALLAIAVAGVSVAGVVAAIAGVAAAVGGVAATVVGIPLGLLLVAGLTWLGTALSLAPTAIVLERKNIPSSIRRSVALVRRRFWRIFTILALAGVVAAVVAGAVSVPFSVASGMLSFGSEGQSPIAPASAVGSAVGSVGQAIGAIITTPFLAGVMTLLYVDARFRSEALDFTLMTAAPGHPDADRLWLGR